MEITQAKRVFIWKDKEYADPNPAFTINQVADHYAGLYPEWVTASITQDNVKKDGTIVYNVKSDFKEKG
jgi:PRTRC genetic system protein C